MNSGEQEAKKGFSKSESDLAMAKMAFEATKTGKIF
jgi:hypothetical protein